MRFDTNNFCAAILFSRNVELSTHVHEKDFFLAMSDIMEKSITQNFAICGSNKKLIARAINYYGKEEKSSKEEESSKEVKAPIALAESAFLADSVAFSKQPLQREVVFCKVDKKRVR